MKSELAKATAPLAAEGGMTALPHWSADPIADWIALMEVVEMLCPRWPERPLRRYWDCRL